MTRSNRDRSRAEPQLAPDRKNYEQDNYLSQAQEVTKDAMEPEARMPSPLESEKGRGETDLMNDSTQDLVDRMRDQEQDGRIDMSAYGGEPNHDDNTDKYGPSNKLDDLPGDGASGKPPRPAR